MHMINKYFGGFGKERSKNEKNISIFFLNPSLGLCPHLFKLEDTQALKIRPFYEKSLALFSD